MVSTFTLSLLMPRDGLETKEGCGERPQHACAPHGALLELETKEGCGAVHSLPCWARDLWLAQSKGWPALHASAHYGALVVELVVERVLSERRREPHGNRSGEWRGVRSCVRGTQSFMCVVQTYLMYQKYISETRSSPICIEPR